MAANLPGQQKMTSFVQQDLAQQNEAALQILAPGQPACALLREHMRRHAETEAVDRSQGGRETPMDLQQAHG